MQTETQDLDLRSNTYLDLASFTLLFYDFCLTLDLEISRYWGSRLNFGAILFFANRYGMLLGNIPVAIQNLWTTVTNSNPRKITALVGLILIIRTYALYHKSKRILVFMIFVAIATVGVALRSAFNTPPDIRSDNVQQHVGCAFGITKPRGVNLAIAWAGSGVSDFIIFLLTLYKGLSSGRSRGTNFLTLLLRDGSIYFGVMTLSNIWNISSFVLYTRGISTTFTNIISSLMISRLMLNLRDPSLLHIPEETPEPLTDFAPEVYTAPSRGVGV
ncbi:hypothetical protein C8R45DRAFT_1089288 [Mycena sanguinolenta]|nr:hypothetical protein C8R45DRAFT_1089288 [Mycena sanguinolenta]